VTGYFSYTGEDKQPAPSRKDKMRKFFLIQTGIILLLIYIQMYVQEGSYKVGFKTLGSFIVLLSITFALAMVVIGIRKLINRNVNFPDGVIKLSIFIFPIYYVAQLVGWLYDQGMIGGG
jgi:hypothetical protein